MSSIHYKLKSTLEYKTLTFDGLHISVDDLKKMICDKENIRTESFDLILTNTHTKRQYNSEDLVPRNSSVIVQRIPRENALKLPKVQDTSTSGIVNRSAGIQSKESAHISSEDYAKMTEEEKLAHVKQQSTMKYHSDNFNKKTTGILTGPPPPTYVCNRCSQPGHWFKACPLLNTKRTTGIPMEELMETTPDDPQAMLHPSGKYVVQIRHHLARLNKKTETVGGGGGTPKETEDAKEIPPELSCRLCKNLLKEAMLAVCCGDSFCAECMQQKMLEDAFGECPGDSCHEQISTDALVPNKKIREAVHKFLNSNMGPGRSAEQAIVNKPDASPHSLLQKLLPDLQAPPAVASTPSQNTSHAVQTGNYEAKPIYCFPDIQKQPPMRVDLTQSSTLPSRSFTSLPTNNIVGSAPVAVVPPQAIYPPKVEQLSFPPPTTFDFSVPPPSIPIVQPSSLSQTTSPSAPLSSGMQGPPVNNEFSTAWEKLLMKGKEELPPQQSTTPTSQPMVPLDKIQKQQSQHVTSTTVVIPQVPPPTIAPIVPIVAATANRQPPIPGSEVEEADSSTFTSEPSKEIKKDQDLNDAWESFLKRKDEEKEKKQRSPVSKSDSNDSSSSSSSSSNSSRSSSSSSSSASSSGSRKHYRHSSSRKRSSKDRRYSSGSRSRRQPMMTNSYGIRAAQYQNPGQILYGSNYMSANVGVAGFGQPMMYQGQQQLYGGYGAMHQIGHQQPFHYQPNFRRQGPPPHRYDSRRDSLPYRGGDRHKSPERRRSDRGDSDRKRDSSRNKSPEKPKRGRSKERHKSKDYENSKQPSRESREESRKSRPEKEKDSKDKEPKEKSSESKLKRHSSREKVTKNVAKSKDKTGSSERVSAKSSKRTEEERQHSKDDKKDTSKGNRSRNEAKSDKKIESAGKRKQELKPEKNTKQEAQEEDEEEEEDEIERIIQETKRIKKTLPAEPSPQKPVNLFEKLALSALPKEPQPEPAVEIEEKAAVETSVVEPKHHTTERIAAVIDDRKSSMDQHEFEECTEEKAKKSPGETQLENISKDKEVPPPESTSSPIQKSANIDELDYGQEQEKQQVQEDEDNESKKKKDKKRHKHKHHHKQESKKKRKEKKHSRSTCLKSRSSTPSHSKAVVLVHNQLDGFSSSNSKSDSKPKSSHRSKKDQHSRKVAKKAEHYPEKSAQKVSKSGSHKSRDHKSSNSKPEKKHSTSRHSTSKRKSLTNEDEEEDTRKQLKRHKSSREEQTTRKRGSEALKSIQKDEEMNEIQLFYD